MTPRLVVATAHSVQSAVAEARRQLGLKLRDSRELTRSESEQGMYRVTLVTGDVVEVQTVQHGRATAMIVGAA